MDEPTEADIERMEHHVNEAINRIGTDLGLSDARRRWLVSRCGMNAFFERLLPAMIEARDLDALHDSFPRN